MKYIDAHAHLNLEEFSEDVNTIAEKTKLDDVFVVNVGTGEQSSKRAVELAQKYEHMKAIIGLHPIHASPSYDQEHPERFSGEFYEKLYSENKDHILAIGECGLDYFHGNAESKEMQKVAFRAQIVFAGEKGLPLMLHIRPSENSFDAYFDAIDILKEYQEVYPNLIGDVHFFAGNKEIAQSFLDMGYYISFTGVITFAKMYEDLVSFVPLDRILSETDSPYVAPKAFRGKRNEPSHVREVVKKIAEIKGVDEKIVQDQIRENAKKLFELSY